MKARILPILILFLLLRDGQGNMQQQASDNTYPGAISYAKAYADATNTYYANVYKTAYGVPVQNNNKCCCQNCQNGKQCSCQNCGNNQQKNCQNCANGQKITTNVGYQYPSTPYGYPPQNPQYPSYPLSPKTPSLPNSPKYPMSPNSPSIPKVPQAPYSPPPQILSPSQTKKPVDPPPFP